MIMVTLLSSRIGWQEALFRNGVLLVVQVLVFYLNLFVFLPRLLERKKYLYYASTILVILAIGVWTVRITDDLVINDDVAQQKFREISKHHDNKSFRRHRRVLRHGRTVMHSISLFGILFISTLMRNITERMKREKETIALRNQALEAESKFLKSQVNPHFLFNSLNNIYALAQMKSDLAPDAIHKLSQMLRYVLYESNGPLVTLQQELTYVNSYVELQKLKDDSLNVKLDLQNVNPGMKVAPLLFIPFIENGFKHSHIEDVENGWIEISIISSDNTLSFEVRNSIAALDVKKDSVGGVGLENVKRRLDLLYKDKHELQIDESSDVYKVKLTLELA